jgi:hypothetical protein
MFRPTVRTVVSIHASVREDLMTCGRTS